jgi:hypothetical protein
MTYEIFQDNDKKWRWRSISASGHVFISEKVVGSARADELENAYREKGVQDGD